MIRKKRTFWLWAGAALGSGLLLRLWFVVHISLIDGDSLIYGGIAKDWLLHGIYGFTQGGHTPNSVDPTLIRLPGYPIFLARSEEHTSELQSLRHLVCRLLL